MTNAPSGRIRVITPATSYFTWKTDVLFTSEHGSIENVLFTFSRNFVLNGLHIYILLTIYIYIYMCDLRATLSADKSIISYFIDKRTV